VSLPVRITALLVAFAAVVVGAVFVVIHYIGASPPVVDYTSMASGGQVNVVLQEDPQNTVSSHPDWVSYFVQNPSTHQWIHTTLFKVPAKTRVNMTILGYDGCTPLRNNFWSKVQGTIGGDMTVQQFKTVGQPIGGPKTYSVLNSWSGCNVAHTFAIPSLHVFVPIASPVTALFNSSACGVSPCTSGPHSMVKFSFMTPAVRGIGTAVYRWQCFIPCGGGFVFGNGGPMSTIGFMTGNMEVQA
jgi:hypothetical protein